MKEVPSNKIIHQAIGQKLKELRKEKGFKNYEQFAFTYELSRAQYGRYEKGANMTINTLHRLLQIHNISITEFFDDYFQEIIDLKTKSVSD